MRYVVVSIILPLAAIGAILAFGHFYRGADFSAAGLAGQTAGIKVKSPEELIKEAYEKSSFIKGVYITGEVAGDRGAAATRLREKIKQLIRETELNGAVIDVKESEGVILNDNIKNFVGELHSEGVWTIARLVSFRDNSAVKSHPEFYIKNKNGSVWRDKKGMAWIDPANKSSWDYIAGVAKQAIDAGFDEIQFDYVRFPSDGDLSAAVYPVYDSKTPKYEVMKMFFGFINKELKNYKPDVILSVDLFGYVALQGSDLGIGQRMEDLGDSFDYISFMIYPSHYYAGFYIQPDAKRNLPSLYFPYRAKDPAEVASSHPYEIVHRSLLFAKDFLDGVSVPTRAISTASSSQIAATSTALQNFTPRSRARLRPWLQAFDLGVDLSRGIQYDADKIRAEIKAAEDAGASGWLLWNASNVYNEAALMKN